MPEPVEPDGGLQSRAQGARRRERSRKRQRMCNHDQGTEQIAARYHQQCPLTQNEELSEQKSGGHAVADKQGGGKSRYERVDFGQLDGRKGPCAEKDDEQGQQKSARQAALTGSWGNVRQNLRLGGARRRRQRCVRAFRHWTQGPFRMANSRLLNRAACRRFFPGPAEHQADEFLRGCKSTCPASYVT